MDLKQNLDELYEKVTNFKIFNFDMETIYSVGRLMNEILRHVK